MYDHFTNPTVHTYMWAWWRNDMDESAPQHEHGAGKKICMYDINLGGRKTLVRIRSSTVHTVFESL